MVASFAVAVTPAAAESNSAGLPVYDGALTFPTITSAASPEEYSWRVRLGSGQKLVQVDATDAQVEYESGLRAYLVTTEGAHDSVGAKVPTTLTVTGEEEITLTVQHRNGNPAADGAPFDYPIVGGEGWEGGFWTETVKGPPDEKELREMREREEAAERAAELSPLSTATPEVGCEVPILRGFSLRAAKVRLRADHCKLGKVRLAHGATAAKGKVVKQFRIAGTDLAAGTPVAVKLG